MALRFNQNDLKMVEDSVAVAEDLVSDHFKMSQGSWLKSRFDVKTAADLSRGEEVSGPFAQIIRYEGKPKGGELGSATFDYYKICLQDQAVLTVAKNFPEISLYPFLVYIIVHELVHIVRFSRFLQKFDATWKEKMAEEARVHKITREILDKAAIQDMAPVISYFRNWDQAFETETVKSG